MKADYPHTFKKKKAKLGWGSTELLHTDIVMLGGLKCISIQCSLHYTPSVIIQKHVKEAVLKAGKTMIFFFLCDIHVNPVRPIDRNRYRFFNG